MTWDTRSPENTYSVIICIRMKQLQLTPPLLIVTMGYPGAGKTFFARQFADQYNLPRVSEDIYRFELFERPMFNDDEAEIIQRMMQYSLEQLFKTNQTIVCEGMFLKLAERKQLFDQAKKAGYRTLTVWLQTDIQTSGTRATRRDRRNPDSKHAVEIDARTFNFLKDQLQRPGEKEESIVISGKHAFKSQSLTILRKITGVYADHAASGDFKASQISQSSPTTRRIASRPNQLIQ